MFQVAHGIALARANDSRAEFVDLTSAIGRVRRQWELGCFGFRPLPISRGEALLLKSRIFASMHIQRIWPTFHLGVLHEKYAAEHPAMYQRHSVCWGYWQGERFFDSASALVRRKFSFPEFGGSTKVPKLDKSMSSVAVHVRRGDYVFDPVARARHLVCDANWYSRAMDLMRAKLSQPSFYLFSDDEDWAERTFGEKGDVTVFRGSSDAPAWLDMAQMSQCSHYIISNSSYSWWASYLGKTAESIVIAPQFWFPGVKTVDQELACQDWLLL